MSEFIDVSRFLSISSSLLLFIFLCGTAVLYEFASLVKLRPSVDKSLPATEAACVAYQDF